jgi:hypothetical protein
MMPELEMEIVLCYQYSLEPCTASGVVYTRARTRAGQVQGEILVEWSGIKTGLRVGLSESDAVDAQD